MRVLIADCSVEYEGRLGARLPRALRLVLLKADGSIAVHADAKAYKPLNWMNPPCTIRAEDGRLVAVNPGGERLTIELHEVVHDYAVELGDDPGLAKDGVEAELQDLISRRVVALRDGLRLVRREYPTDIGPVDLLCRDGDGGAVVIEVKRIGEIAGVEQLLRYQERLDLDPNLTPTRGSSSRRASSRRRGCSRRAAAWSAWRSTSRSCARVRRSTCACSDAMRPSARRTGTTVVAIVGDDTRVSGTARPRRERRHIRCRARRRPARPRGRGMERGHACAHSVLRARRRSARRHR